MIWLAIVLILVVAVWVDYNFYEVDQRLQKLEKRVKE